MSIQPLASALLPSDRTSSVTTQGSRAASRSFASQLATTVAAQKTPLSGSEAAEALSRAWQDVTGTTIDPKTLRLLVAQWSHETGAGRSMLNYNFGGIKGVGPSQLCVSARTREGSGATERHITDTFRAYRTPLEGATDYVRLLTTRFSGAIRAAQSGNPTEFVHALKQGGYFTDAESSYAASVSRLTETAQNRGFDAIGATRSEHGLPTAAALSRPVQETPFARGPLDPSAFNAFDAIAAMETGARVDTLAFADEVARAAMHIGQVRAEEEENEPKRIARLLPASR